ncbi:YibE/F family protein [Clostridium hydrogenum]|uniref:YibE/F family protein n=1 Tax=Clostridium hydrogenum TaxID=2855764 RepID=UPI001F3D64FD|nr:YibE/F family protein [Clostridium hydrogenum]
MKTNLNLLKKIKSNKFSIYILLLLIFFLLLFYFGDRNEGLYKRTIAKVLSVSNTNVKSSSTNVLTEPLTKQKITAVIMNGTFKGQKISLENTTSYSQARDFKLTKGNEVFISIKLNSKNKISSASILDLKRDKYLIYIVAIFILLILIIGRLKGLKSLSSVLLNIAIFSIAIELFMAGVNLVVACIIASVLFIVLSLIIVCGINKKAASAIIGTLLGTSITMLIAMIVILTNSANGIHFEELNFLNHPPKPIFYMEILIGTLGAIMDIAVSISSSIGEIFLQNPSIETKSLINSGMEIGKDIMGTMANTLSFAYISGSIPVIIVLMANNFSLSNIVTLNISLEITRALIGSIGIVISIPVCIFTSIFFLKNKKIGGFMKS